MTQHYDSRRGRGWLAAVATCALALALPLTACGDDASRSTTVSQTKTVGDVLDERTQDADGAAGAGASVAPTSDGSTSAGSSSATATGGAADGSATSSSGGNATTDDGTGTGPSSAGSAAAPATAAASTDVDIDLTAMGADMVYATVNDMVTKPANYTGKKVRMAGPLYHQYYDKTDTTYHYVVIEDATTCCAQGIEFVMGDGKQDEPVYPTDGTRVTVTGTFEPYLEDGAQYVHLVRSELALG